MNTAGQIGAFLSPIILPYLLKDQSRPEDWAYPCSSPAGSTSPGAFCWLFVDPRKPLVTKPAADRWSNSIGTGSGLFPERRGDLFDHPIDLASDDPGLGAGLQGDEVTVAPGGPRSA